LLSTSTALYATAITPLDVVSWQFGHSPQIISFPSFSKKVVLWLSEHGDVIETQPRIL